MIKKVIWVGVAFVALVCYRVAIVPTRFQEPGRRMTPTIAATNSSIVYYGPWSAGWPRVTITNGAACEFAYTGQTCQLVFDTSTVSGERYPVVAYWVDNVGPTRVNLDATGLLNISPYYDTLPSGSPPFASVSSQAHVVRFMANIESAYPTPIDNWSTQVDALEFEGVNLDSGSSLLSIPRSPNTILFLGDSITAGLRVLYTSRSGDSTAVNAPEIAWPELMCRMIGMKAYVCGHGGQGIGATATDGTPPANTAFGRVFQDVSWTPPPDPPVIVIYMGTNDEKMSSRAFQEAYGTYLGTIRGAFPHSFIVAINPHSASFGPEITAVVAASNDPRIVALDAKADGVISSSDCVDGTHLNPGGGVKLAAWVASKVQSWLNTSSFGKKGS